MRPAEAVIRRERIAMLFVFAGSQSEARPAQGRAFIRGAVLMVRSETNRWSGAFGDLSCDDQFLVARLVKEGGAIKGTVEQIAQRLERTRKLFLLRIKVDNRIIGVAALKTPTSKYRARKFSAAGVPIANYANALELGYVVIAEEMRGQKLSGVLCDAVSQEISEPAFATTDSNTMKKNLERSGFTTAGREWQGRKGMLSLWLITPR